MPAPPPAIRDAAGLAAFLANTPALRGPLAALAALDLPDAWIGAGFVRNALWDALHGLPVGANPPGDVDVVWFDPARASPAADAALEARLRAARPDLPWSVRNQARMAARNDDAPYTGTLDAMAHWPDTATAVAARLILLRMNPDSLSSPRKRGPIPTEVGRWAPASAGATSMESGTMRAGITPSGSVEIAAPWGVDDLLAGIVRPTPAFAADPAKRAVFAQRLSDKGWLRRWPGLRLPGGPSAER